MIQAYCANEPFNYSVEQGTEPHERPLSPLENSNGKKSVLIWLLDGVVFLLLKARGSYRGLGRSASLCSNWDSKSVHWLQFLVSASLSLCSNSFLFLLKHNKVFPILYPFKNLISAHSKCDIWMN